MANPPRAWCAQRTLQTWFSDVQSARYVERVTGNVSRFLAGEVEDGPGDVVHGAQALQRDGAGELVPRRLGQLVGHGRLDVARSHDVDRDVAAAQLAGQRLAEADEPGLGRGVVGLPG